MRYGGRRRSRRNMGLVPACGGQALPPTRPRGVLGNLELHPRDYILYAYDALTKVTELLIEQEADKRA